MHEHHLHSVPRRPRGVYAVCFAGHVGAEWRRISMTSLAISKTARSTCAIPSCCRNCAGTGNFDRFGGEAFGGERLVRRRVRVIRRRFRLAPPWRKKRHANRGGQLRLVRSPLPDVPGQENGRRGTGQAGEPAGSEAQRPGREPRSPAELVERDAEQKCPEEPGTKADAGIEPDCHRRSANTTSLSHLA